MLWDKVKLLGRTYEEGERLFLKDSYTGLSFYCRGDVSLTITPKKEADKDSCPYIGVVIDDDIAGVTKIAVTKELKNIPLVQGDGEIHKVDIVKLTEEQYGNVYFSRLQFEEEASVKKAENLNKKILFIGDSITAGYGVNGIDGEGNFTTSEENVLGSSAILTARKIEAEPFVFASSGDGIISRWITPEADMPDKTDLIPDIFPFENYIFPEPDYIVINLGTNDASFIKDIEYRKKLFESEYIKFVIKLRRLYILPKIIIAYGVMDISLLPVIESLVNKYKEQSGDKNCVFAALEMQKESEGIGAAGHPSIKVNERVSDSLVKVIMEKK